MNVELDQAVERTVDRYHRLQTTVYLVFVTLCFGVIGYAVSIFGKVLGGFIGLGLLVLFVPWFDLRTEGVLESEKSPETVREEFDQLVNPLTSFSIGWADEVREIQSDGNGTAAVLSGKFLWLFSQKYQLRTTHDDDNTIRIQFGTGDDPDEMELSFEPSGEGTRIKVISVNDGKRVTDLLFRFLINPFERRVLEHHGYRNVNRSTDIDIQFP